MRRTDLPVLSPTGLDAYSQNALELPLLCHAHCYYTWARIPRLDRLAPANLAFAYLQATPCGANDLWWFRNINRMSIAYDCSSSA